MKTTNLLSIIFLALIPALGGLYLSASHYYFSDYFPDRFLPIIISLGLLVYLAQQHNLYWDKSFTTKPYFSLINTVVAVFFGILLVLVLFKMNIKTWYAPLHPRSIWFYFLPFILSGYVIPFLLFNHVLVDSTDTLKRFKIIAAAYLIISVCFLLWWIRYTIIAI